VRWSTGDLGHKARGGLLFPGGFRYTNGMKSALRIALLLTATLPWAGAALPALAQEGPLNTAQPTGITVDEIISRFAAKEKQFKEARE